MKTTLSCITDCFYQLLSYARVNKHKTKYGCSEKAVHSVCREVLQQDVAENKDENILQLQMSWNAASNTLLKILVVNAFSVVNDNQGRWRFSQKKSSIF